MVRRNQRKATGSPKGLFRSSRSYFVKIAMVTIAVMMLVVVIFSAVFLIGKDDPTDARYDIFDICINYKPISEEYRKDGFEWIEECREEIHEMRQNIGYRVNASNDENTVKLKTAMAASVLYASWCTTGHSFIPEDMSVNWKIYGMCMTGEDFMDEDYDPDQDATWDRLGMYTGVNLKKDNRYRETVEIARIVYGYIRVSGGKVDQYVSWAKEIAEDDSHGYSQPNRHGPDYDCSSLVCYALREAGFNVPITSTHYMKDIFTKIDGWTWIPAAQLGSMSETAVRTGRCPLLPGDILLNIQTHTEIYIGDHQNVGAHCDEYGGISGRLQGDQTGDEISITPYWNDGWDGVLRYTGE